MPETTHIQKLLLVEDDTDFAESLRHTIKRLEGMRYEVTTVENAEDARHELLNGGYDICIVDINLPDGNGIEIVKTARNRSIPTPAVLITGAHANHSLEIDAVMAGASDMIYKGEIAVASLKRVLHMACLRNEAEIRLREEAIRDKITGLYNRAHLERTLTLEVQRYKRHQQDFSVVFVDMDNFKAINDTYGHRIGDLALSEIANCLESKTRGLDIATRYGGDEFVIVLPQTDHKGGIVVANHILAAISERRIREVDGLRLSASIGVAGSDQGLITEGALMDAADRAALKAKSLGKAQVVLHSSE